VPDMKTTPEKLVQDFYRVSVTSSLEMHNNDDLKVLYLVLKDNEVISINPLRARFPKFKSLTMVRRS
jgi:hypothetical protein